ncbi:sensor histidine kinase [Winogradskyella alexanderae]|uniref:histidine kinase n=1 Tax=Winogradskyella alexanderae TaxID=2877123 RepID=A0ABS7XRM5_9FLAO|nr:ATP-binding protein [Winogradskyella alexanderae]MCA0131602.1 two-component sensor histidine kinase [Winogradskyella alexanderae]
MKIENHVLNILQLYEYAMAIGKSLDYKESCDLFLKLVLKRKNLNAAWILEPHDSYLRSTYAIPFGVEINTKLSDDLSTLLRDIEISKIIEANAMVSTISPFKIHGGCVAVFNLKEQGYLFLYSKKDNLSHKDLSQLEPVIDKFSINLKACKAFRQQQMLLHSLEVQNQELSDYAHMVSHDLKSPLRSIDTLTTWLKEDYAEKIGVAGKQQINTIRNSVEKMDTLINGILDYSTIGKNKIEAYPVELNLLLRDILKIIEIPDHITVDVKDLPVVKGDKFRLQQLFQNLISNAITYNDKPAGKIEIGVANKDQYWEFYVKDNGKGIDKVYYEKIFEAFKKLENNVNSTGIGLSIAKKIVDVYGGKIWLESQINIGTTFYFTLKK